MEGVGPFPMTPGHTQTKRMLLGGGIDDEVLNSYLYTAPKKLLSEKLSFFIIIAPPADVFLFHRKTLGNVHQTPEDRTMERGLESSEEANQGMWRLGPWSTIVSSTFNK